MHMHVYISYISYVWPARECAYISTHAFGHGHIAVAMALPLGLTLAIGKSCGHFGPRT